MSGKTHICLVPAALLLLLPAVASPDSADDEIQAPKGIVDCLLPGPLRRVGGSMYQLPSRPARLTATECTIRGGDFLLYDRANYETSLKHWITQAERDSGDADAMLYVGEIYEQGIGRDPDYAAAASWYQKAADAGSTTAMISLAHLHKTGQGVPMDLSMAQALYSQAFGSEIPIPLDPTSVKGADQRIETLVAEVDEVRRQKIAVDLELQAANEQLLSARVALDDALAGDGENSDLISELQSVIANQESGLATYQSNINAIRAENSELRSLRQQLEDQQLEMSRLNDLLAGAESTAESSRRQLIVQQQALDAREAEFEALLADANADRNVIQASSKARDEHRDEIRRLEVALRKTEEERILYQVLANDSTTQQDRVATLTARITVLEQKSGSAESEFGALRSELTATKSQLEEQLKTAVAATQASDAEIAARGEEIARLRAAVARAEKETNRHRSDIDNLSHQSLELEQLRADLEREQAQSNRLQQLLTDLQGQYADSNTRLEQVDAARTRLQNEIAALSASTSAGDHELLQRRESELSSADNELATLQLRIAESEEDFRRYQQQMADTAARQSTAIENLRDAVASSRVEREHLEEQLSSAHQQLVSAQSDLELERQRYTAIQDELREARAQNTTSSETLQAKQRLLDDESQQVALLQQEIDRLKDQSNRYAAQIDDLKAIAQSKTVEFTGPRIVMLEPDENVFAETGMPTRGEGLTRGISVVATSRVRETKVVRGRVEAPAGLAKLTINGWQVPYDKHNAFTQPLELDTESKLIKVVAVDHNGKQDVKEFEYRIDGTIRSKDVRFDDSLVNDQSETFEESRNDALDHLNYYALIIANEDYENEFVRDLETPIADAEAIGAVLENRYGFEVEILKNANQRTMDKVFERIFYDDENDDIEENDKDAILIYYAGHGFGSDSRTNDAYFWAPVDAEFNSPSTWFKTRDIEDYMQVSATKQIMVVADSCFAGSVLSRDGQAGDYVSPKARNFKKFLTEYTERKESRWVLTSGGLAPVLDGGGDGHSVFARAILDVLLENNEILSAGNVHERVAPIVLDLAERQNFEQTPLFGYLRSAGHAFGNFYLPAPQYPAQLNASIDEEFFGTADPIVTQANR